MRYKRQQLKTMMITRLMITKLITIIMNLLMVNKHRITMITKRLLTTKLKMIKNPQDKRQKWFSPLSHSPQNTQSTTKFSMTKYKIFKTRSTDKKKHS